jgi:hypothetical protein
MERGRLIYIGLFGVLLAIGLSGCIISTTPGTSRVIEMHPGETMIFKVITTPASKFYWYIYRMDGNSEGFYGTDHIEFTVNPDGENTNRVVILCECYNYQLTDSEVDGLHFDWVLTGSRTWNIGIPRNTTPVWQGDYYIKDSTDVQLLNGYTEVTGSLMITESNIRTLSGLENLTSVGGDLEIKYNDTLRSLSGLENITSIGGELNIKSNYVLKDLSSLDNLTSIGGDLDVKNNDVLTSMSGLENLISVGGDLNVENNDVLTSLSGLENITSIPEGLVIRYNDHLISLSGLENLTSVGNLIITNNADLTFLGMTGLHRIDGDFEISVNPLLFITLAEELRDQVLSREGIGGKITIRGNKDCTAP